MGRVASLALGVAILLGATPAAAHHYDVVAVDKTTMAAADRDSVVREGFKAYAWFSFYFPDEDADPIVKQLTEFDCGRGRIRAINQTYYRADGRRLASIDFVGEWAQARPGDRVEAMLLYACKGPKNAKRIAWDDRELYAQYKQQVEQGFRVFEFADPARVRSR